MLGVSPRFELSQRSFMNSTPLTKEHPPLRPDIEGLRAIAILLVVAYHARIPGFTGGFVGVDIFFVLSGYLITWLLVWEVESKGTLSLMGFYARRARRLLPALGFLLFMTALVGFALYSPLEQRVLATTSFSTAAYVSNLYFARAATDYLGAEAETNPLLHTWSLSVEEQFYLVWPLLVMLALGATPWQMRTANRRRLLLWMVAVSLVSFALSVWLTSTRQPFAFFLSPLRGWEFAVGGLAILAPPLKSLVPLGKKANSGEARLQAMVTSNMLAWAGIVGLLAAAVFFHRETPFPGVAALLPVLATVAVLRASHTCAECTVAKMLSTKPLQVIGRLSYSWYLWHWPILVFAAAGWGETKLPVRVVLLAISLVFAEGSYRFIEAPIRHNKALVGRSSLSLAMAAVITLTGATLSLAWRYLSIRASESPAQRRFTMAANDIPTLYAAGCHADFYDVDAVGCTFGPEDSSTTMVLFGDSHAAQWFPALQAIAQDKGWRLVSLTKSACPPVGGIARFDRRLGRDYRECHEWQQNVLKRIGKIRPSLIITSGSVYGYNRNELQKGMESFFQDLSNSGSSIINILESPHPGFDVPTCLARAARNPFMSMSSCGFDAGGESMGGLHDIQRRATSRYTNVFNYNMTDSICPGGKCMPEMGGIVTYRDSNHLTASFSQSLAPALARQLDEVLAHQRSKPDSPRTQ
jgi:peptidoglycan/LPS O-acetylase OafA/YrhL